MYWENQPELPSYKGSNWSRGATRDIGSPPLRKHCILGDPLTLPQGRLTGIKLGKVIHRHDFHSLRIPSYIQAYQSSTDIFTHIILEKYLEAMWWHCYDGVYVKFIKSSLSKPNLIN